eukprot:268911-Chlamydomonas_euryale.AAC.1
MLGGQRLRRPAPGSRGWSRRGQSPWEVWGVRRVKYGVRHAGLLCATATRTASGAAAATAGGHPASRPPRPSG